MKPVWAPSTKPVPKENAAPSRTLSSGKWSAATANVPESGSSVAAANSESRLAARAPSSRSIKTSEPVRIALGEMPAEPVLVSVTSRSHDDVLEYTHSFVVAYASRRFRKGLVQPISVATYELLGNALNYGSALGEVVLQLVESPTSIGVRVSNDTVPVRIDMLRSHLERVGKDPESAFLEEMRRSVSGGASKPMLGLARIVHEAKLSIELYIAGTRLAIVARLPT